MVAKEKCKIPHWLICKMQHLQLVDFKVFHNMTTSLQPTLIKSRAVIGQEESSRNAWFYCAIHLSLKSWHHYPDWLKFTNTLLHIPSGSFHKFHWAIHFCILIGWFSHVITNMLQHIMNMLCNAVTSLFSLVDFVMWSKTF